MKSVELSAKAQLSRIAVFSAVIGAFLLCSSAIRAAFNSRLNAHYQRAVTVLAAIEDVDAAVKDMLIASKGLLVGPSNQAEWDESRRAGIQFRRALGVALRHSENDEITAALKATEDDFDDILKTTGARFKRLLQRQDPSRVAFYYESHYPRVHQLSSRLLATKEKAFVEAADWFHDKETLGKGVEVLNLLVVFLSIALLIYRTKALSQRLAGALEGVSRAVIQSAHSIGGVSRKMDSTSQILEGASRQQASLVGDVVSNMGIVTTAAASNATEADFGLARSAESWFVSFSVRQNVDQLVAAMRELQAGSRKLQAVMEQVGELRASGAPESGEFRARLDVILGELGGIVGNLNENSDAGENLSHACVESFDNLNVALQQITDSVRSIEALSKAQRDEIVKVDQAITHISDGTQKSAEASRQVVDEASVLKAETRQLLESVERLKQISMGIGEDERSAA